MITHHASKGLIWLDVSSPTDEEITGLVKRYSLHPLVGEELKRSSSLAKIDFVIGKNFLITSRNDTIEQLEYFSKIFEANSILNKDKEDTMEHAGHLFYFMVKKIYAGMCEDLENIKDSLVSAETRIFKGAERNMVEVLSDLSRELIDFKQTVRIHEEIWADVIMYDHSPLFGKDFVVYMRDLRDEFTRTRELIANGRELLADLRETNDSLLNTKQNDIIKRLTVVTFIFQPLTFIAALFTIPALNVPLIEHGFGWYGIFVLMIVVTGGIWWFFRKKGWI